MPKVQRTRNLARCRKEAKNKKCRCADTRIIVLVASGKGANSHQAEGRTIIIGRTKHKFLLAVWVASYAMTMLLTGALAH